MHFRHACFLQSAKTDISFKDIKEELELKYLKQCKLLCVSNECLQNLLKTPEDYSFPFSWWTYTLLCIREKPAFITTVSSTFQNCAGRRPYLWTTETLLTNLSSPNFILTILTGSVESTGEYLGFSSVSWRECCQLPCTSIIKNPATM